MSELHGVFAVTIYGDKVRVTHYSDWNDAVNVWEILDDRRIAGFGPEIVKYYAVRSWADPDWNTARYRNLETLVRTEA